MSAAGGIRRRKGRRERFALLILTGLLCAAVLFPFCFPVQAAALREACTRFATGGAELEDCIAALGDALTDGGLPEAAEVWYELLFSGETEDGADGAPAQEDHADSSRA